jgi:hypothetical protein
MPVSTAVVMIVLVAVGMVLVADMPIALLILDNVVK